VERGQMSKEEYNQAWQEIKGELKGSK